MSSYSVIPNSKDYSLVSQLADLIVSNSVAFVDTDIIINVEAGKSYFVILYLVLTAEIGAGFKLRCVSTPIYQYQGWGEPEDLENMPLLSTDITHTGFSGGSTTQRPYFLYMSFKSLDTGTITIQWTQNTVAISDTIFRKECTAMIYEVDA